MNKKLNNAALLQGPNWLKKLAESDERLPLTLSNDFAFKTTFQNEKALCGLLSAFLSIPVAEIRQIEFADPFVRGETPDEKEGILDLKLHLNNKRKINIEMQVLPFPYWEERSLYYLSKMFTEGFQRSGKYKELEECIHISILKFDLYENPPLYSIVQLWDLKNKHLYSDKISLRMLQLRQLDKVPKEQQDDIYRWAKMISTDDWEVLTMLAENNEYMDAAKSELEKINADKRKRYEYLQREKREHDEATLQGYYQDLLTNGIREGMEKGREEGEKRISSLYSILLEEKRTVDLERSITDAAYRKKMLDELGV